jgi:hypothetical protein
MQRKKWIWTLCAVLAVLGVLAAALLLPQPPEEESYAWAIPAEGGNITAAFSDNGRHGFILTLTGSGTMKDFATDKDAPWYGRSGRVTRIVIPEGVTAIGDNAFAQCHYVRTVVLPRSVTSIGSNAFSDNTQVCVYGETAAADDLRLYRYAEEKPGLPGDYWHFREGDAVVWEKMKVLFIGNSFTYYNDMDQLFASLVEAAGYDVQVERITIGGHNLSQYATPADEGGRQVEAALTACSDYDMIVLQEQSTRPITNPALFEDGVTRLCSRIRETQKDCRIFLYATWGYPEQAAAKGQTVPEMEAQLRAAYLRAAGKAGALVSPVGEAFTAVHGTHGDINLYADDQRHPSYEGSYLAACVHAAKLLGIDPRGSAFIGELSPETAMILQQTAYTTVLK